MHVVSVSVSIQVLSRREGTFSVTCTATGGTVLTSSFTGPGGVDLVLQPVGTVGRTGQNTYSVTSDTISGRSNGDTYLCTATDGVSSPAPSDSAVLAGIVYTMSCVSMVGSDCDFDVASNQFACDISSYWHRARNVKILQGRPGNEVTCIKYPPQLTLVEM